MYPHLEGGCRSFVGPIYALTYLDRCPDRCERVPKHGARALLGLTAREELTRGAALDKQHGEAKALPGWGEVAGGTNDSSMDRTHDGALLIRTLVVNPPSYSDAQDARVMETHRFRHCQRHAVAAARRAASALDGGHTVEEVDATIGRGGRPGVRGQVGFSLRGRRPGLLDHLVLAEPRALTSRPPNRPMLRRPPPPRGPRTARRGPRARPRP